MIRQKAEALRDGTFKSRGESILPLVLANLIFDALIMPVNREGRCSLQSGVYHLATDETLGFEAAVSALGLKANVSEAEHPLLCEGTRRQRGDLALGMLLHYKDDPEKLSKIMDKLLDREVHQLCKFPLPAAYYSNNPPTNIFNSGHRNEDHEVNHRHNNTPSPVNSNGFQSTVGQQVANGEQVNSTSPRSPILPMSSQPSSQPTETPQSRSMNSASGETEQSTSSRNSPPVASSSTSLVQANSAPSAGSSRPTKESGRFKGKRSYPVLPNQPSEAGAHFMFELGKIILSKAGGSSNQSLFTQPSNGQNQRGPHRALHMCAFHIGLYALGLHNAVSPNWLGRTYSSHVSWITGNANPQQFSVFLFSCLQLTNSFPYRSSNGNRSPCDCLSY